MEVLTLQGSSARAIIADALKSEGSIDLRNGFVSDGEVRLLGATIGGDLDAERGTFRNSTGYALSADRVNVTGDVILRQGFSAEGEVRFPNATIGGNLDAVGGRFSNSKGDAFLADGLKVMGNVFFRNGYRAQGTVRLVGAVIGGDLDATSGAFSSSTGDALDAERIVVNGNVLLAYGFVGAGPVWLPWAQIKGKLAVVDAWLDAVELQGANVTGPLFWLKIHRDENPDFPKKVWNPSLDLTFAKVGVLADQATSWPEKGLLGLDGFLYGRFVEGPTDATTRLKWLDLQPERDGYLPQPYEQLIAVFQEMGLEDQVAEVAIAKQKAFYERGGLGPWAKFWSWVLYLVVDYGYKPWLAFLWMAGLVILGTLMFSLARSRSVPVMVPTEKDAYESDEKKESLPHYYPKFNSFVYSLDVIFPFDLGQKSHWRLRENQSGALVYWIFQGYSLFQLFSGWVLLLIAAAVPAGLIK